MIQELFIKFLDESRLNYRLSTKGDRVMVFKSESYSYFIFNSDGDLVGIDNL